MRPCFPPDYEFSENCGLNDSGDHVSRPFKECPIGQCNPDNAELCSPCGGGATAPAPAGSRSGTQRRCREVLVGLRRAWARVPLAGGGAGVEGVVWDWMGGVWIKGGGCSPTEENGVGA